MNTGRNVGSAAELQVRLAKGWKPNRYLTNMSMAFFNQASEYVATNIFPICPVDFSTGYYYVYNKGILQEIMYNENRNLEKQHLLRWDTQMIHIDVKLIKLL